MNPIPDNAQEALSQGWMMVFVIPPPHSKNYPNAIVNFRTILKCALNPVIVPFTRSGAALPEDIFAFWVKDVKWPDGIFAILKALYTYPEAVDFGKKIMAVHEPEFQFDRRKKLSQVLKELDRSFKKRRAELKVLHI